MAIDLTTERVLNLPEAAKLFPSYRRGKPTHVSRIIRALTVGSKGPDGTRVKLEGLRLCGQWVTSAEAIQRFAERLTPTDPDAPEIHTPASRRKAIAAADRELAALGV